MIERARIKRADSKLIVIDDGSDESMELLDNITRAQRELGSNIAIERVDDTDDIHDLKVKKLPAVISVKKELKSFGKVIDKEVIKEWIKALL
jgi:hypothetical protein